MDWYSHRVLRLRISNTLEAVFCVDCLGDALREHGTQFTSEAFTGVLKRERPHQAL